MKAFLRILFFTILTINFISIKAQNFLIHKNLRDFSNLQSIFLPRPQGLNSAALFNPYIYRCGCNWNCNNCECNSHLNCLNGNCKNKCSCKPNYFNNCCENFRFNNFFDVGYRFNQTLNSKKIATGLFSNDNLLFQGSLVTGRSDNAIVADFFGLSPAYSGNLIFKPQIIENCVDFRLRRQLTKCTWFELATTLVRSKWDLQIKTAKETTDNNLIKIGLTPNFPLYMSADGNNFATNLKQVLGGNFTFGDMTKKWDYGKFNLDPKVKTGIANLDLILGLDMFICSNSHLSIFGKVVAPTGTKLDRKYAEYIFNPVIGNGHHWEVGAGLDAHLDLFSYDQRCLSIYLTGSITHLFKTKQWRTFDFTKHGPLSRYMLLKELIPLDDPSDPRKYDYAGSLINAVNYTTREIVSSFDMQGDVTLQLVYKKCGWALGAGYNCYGRSKENLKKSKNFINAIDTKFFGIKGNTGAYYQHNIGGGVFETLPLNAIQTNSPSLTMTTLPEDSFGFPASNQEVDNSFLLEPITDLTWDNLTPAESLPPIILNAKDNTLFNIVPYPRQIIHKLFAHINYQWDDNCYHPYIGIYGECDFIGKHQYSTPREWGILIRGGILF